MWVSCDLFTSGPHNHQYILGTFWVDPHSDLLQNALVKPKNCDQQFQFQQFSD